MKKLLIILFIAAFGFTSAAPASASDWDKAGMALTGIEGLRIISGGRIDLIGSMFGINNRRMPRRYVKHARKHNDRDRYICSERVWVPHYSWEKKYVPRHEEYHPRYGKVTVEGHYVKVKVERGGHWETGYYCDY